jgi:hypothetical protein
MACPSNELSYINPFIKTLRRTILWILIATAWIATGQDIKPPVRVAVVGLSHDHAYGFFPQLRGRSEVELVGVVETNRALIETYTRRFNLSSNLFYSSLDDLFARTKVQLVATFTSTFEHRAVVERCAKEHVDVMMEKPLAVNMKHARAIEAAAKRGNIQVFVNYETTWYPANHAAYAMVHDRKEIGEIRKIVVHDGHRGPARLRVPPGGRGDRAPCNGRRHAGICGDDRGAVPAAPLPLVRARAPDRMPCPSGSVAPDLAARAPEASPRLVASASAGRALDS